MAVAFEYAVERLALSTDRIGHGDVDKQNGIDITAVGLLDKILKRQPVLVFLNNKVCLSTCFVLAIDHRVIAIGDGQRGGIVGTGKGAASTSVYRERDRTEQAVGQGNLGVFKCHTDKTTVVVGLVALNRACKG